MSVSDILSRTDSKRLATDPEYFEDTLVLLAERLVLESETDSANAFAVAMCRADDMLMEKAF